MAVALAASELLAGAALARRLATAAAIDVDASEHRRRDERADDARRGEQDDEHDDAAAADARDRAAPLPDVAMPTIRLDTTSGITVIRIALTNSVPTGSTTRRRRGATDRGRSRSAPARQPTPAASAMRTRVVSDTRQSYALNAIEAEARALRENSTNDKTREAPSAPRAIV